MIVETVVGDVFETKISYIVSLIPFAITTEGEKEIETNYFLGQLEEHLPRNKMNEVFERTPQIASINESIFMTLSNHRAFVGICYNSHNTKDKVMDTIVSEIDKMNRHEIALVLMRKDLSQRYDNMFVEDLLKRLNKSPTKIHLYCLHEEYF